VFERMPQGAFSMERVVFPELAEQGELSGFPFEGHFVDAGTPASYIEAVQTSIGNQAWISGDSADGGNWFGEDVIIDSVVDLEGCSIGSGTRISNSCSLVSSALLHSVTVGQNSHIKGCMVGYDTHIGQGCQLENVVIDHHSTIPDGHVQIGGTYPTAD